MVIIKPLPVDLEEVSKANYPMHHQHDIYYSDSWGSTLGHDSTANPPKSLAPSQVADKQAADSNIPRKYRPRSTKKTNRQGPSLKGKILESIVLHPGDRCEAQLHPNVTQMDYVVSGEARIGVVGRKGDVEIQYASEGEVSHIPTGFKHWIENMSDSAPLLVLVLANENT